MCYPHACDESDAVDFNRNLQFQSLHLNNKRASMYISRQESRPEDNILCINFIFKKNWLRMIQF